MEKSSSVLERLNSLYLEIFQDIQRLEAFKDDIFQRIHKPFEELYIERKGQPSEDYDPISEKAHEDYLNNIFSQSFLFMVIGVVEISLDEIANEIQRVKCIPIRSKDLGRGKGTIKSFKKYLEAFGGIYLQDERWNLIFDFYELRNTGIHSFFRLKENAFKSNGSINRLYNLNLGIEIEKYCSDEFYELELDLIDDAYDQPPKTYIKIKLGSLFCDRLIQEITSFFSELKEKHLAAFSGLRKVY